MKDYREDITIFIVLIIIFLFLVFYMIKLNGYWDFSGKYGVESTECSQINDNATLVLDNDLHTTWGTVEMHYPEEVFLFRFRQDIEFNSISIINAEYKDNPSVKVDFYVSNDEIEWALCEGELHIEEGKYMYTFAKTYSGKYLRLVYAEDEPGLWPISEMIIE